MAPARDAWRPSCSTARYFDGQNIPPQATTISHDVYLAILGSNCTQGILDISGPSNRSLIFTQDNAAPCSDMTRGVSYNARYRDVLNFAAAGSLLRYIRIRANARAVGIGSAILAMGSML